MLKLQIDQEACKSCGYCIRFCPKHALSFSNRRNRNSYYYVQANVDQCICCGICYTVCPDMVFSITEVQEEDR